MKTKTIIEILKGVLFCELYNLFLLSIIIVNYIHNDTYIFEGSSEYTGTPEKMDISINEWILTLPYWALKEEIQFRLLPMMIWLFIVFCLRIKYSVCELYVYRITLGIGIVTSIWFGYVHGNYLNIFIQGVPGFIFFMVFYNVYRIEKSMIKATLASTINHLITNLLVVLYNYY
ncbi:hypothetical protein XF24_00780 [candidate division SR1 bacterium Aalborg_AAW-1]|nr:hypothetical protein XF24_00780 [candidate division SR1 bacterium Aalborg_AAW-1]